MPRKLIVTLAIVLLGCVFIVFILYAFSDKPNAANNGFNRSFFAGKLILEKSYDLTYTGYYWAGKTNKTVYLAHSIDPTRVIQVRADLSDTLRLQVSLEGVDSFITKYSRIEIDSPYVFLHEGVSPSFFRGHTKDFKLSRFLRHSPYFNLSLNISPTSFIIRGTSRKSNENVFLKIQDYDTSVMIKDNILEKQVDGIFCTDGIISYDKENNIITYLYYFRNEYLVLDSSLNLIKRGTTIDTNFYAKLQLADIPKSGKRIKSAPAMVVNKYMHVDDKKLYVLSALRADNERMHDFEDSADIDVYSLSDCAYLHTIRVPPFNNSELTKFVVIKDKLITLSDNRYLCLYRVLE